MAPGDDQLLPRGVDAGVDRDVPNPPQQNLLDCSGFFLRERIETMVVLRAFAICFQSVIFPFIAKISA